MQRILVGTCSPMENLFGTTPSESTEASAGVVSWPDTLRQPVNIMNEFVISNTLRPLPHYVLVATNCINLLPLTGGRHAPWVILFPSAIFRRGYVRCVDSITAQMNVQENDVSAVRASENTCSHHIVSDSKKQGWRKFCHQSILTPTTPPTSPLLTPTIYLDRPVVADMCTRASWTLSVSDASIELCVCIFKCWSEMVVPGRRNITP